jgi:pyruvate-ferredoxin/flavodoxin oxidoreductase
VVVSGPIVEETRRVAEYWLALSRQAHPQPVPEPRTALEPEPAPTASASPAAPSGTGVWIESARCATCDECVRRSPRMFQYDADKRAVVRDARAGSYREIVEAAEHCKLAIIHPGAPWDENEPDLAELRQRAAAFT